MPPRANTYGCGKLVAADNNLSRGASAGCVACIRFRDCVRRLSKSNLLERDDGTAPWWVGALGGAMTAERGARRSLLDAADDCADWPCM